MYSSQTACKYTKKQRDEEREVSSSCTLHSNITIQALTQESKKQISNPHEAPESQTCILGEKMIL